MESLLYGFSDHIYDYTNKEIYIWILCIGIINLISWLYVTRNAMTSHYMKLIRYQKVSAWWYQSCGRVIGFSSLLAVLWYGILILFQYVIPFIVSGMDCEIASVLETICGKSVIFAFLLFAAALIMMNLFQNLLVQWTYGAKLSFLAVILVEVLSLYAGVAFPESVNYFPGSFLMYNRSNLAASHGFHVEFVFILEFVICLFVILGGQILLQMKCRKGVEDKNGL